jgi:hypothetical protein
MARLAAILKALATALRRDQKSFASFASNNFFIIALVMMDKAGAFIYLLIGLVILFPLSTDPLRKIPASRLAFWPLENRERRLLRVLSPWINPVSWAIAAVAVWTVRGKVTVGLSGLVAGMVAAGFLISELPAPAHGMLRRVPDFPGTLNQLIRKNLREILATLDFYCALLLSVCVCAYRWSGHSLPPEAFTVLTALVVLALSSYAQCLFGLDGRGGLGRYRLLPLSGWQILLAKDAAFLLVATVLTLPLDILPGLVAAFATLALGHKPSVEQPRPQMRWRFTGGAGLPYYFLQAGIIGLAASVRPLIALGPCVLVWAVSVAWYGRRFR